MGDFEQAFEASQAVPTPEVTTAAPQFNTELVGMFMRAHGNVELSNMLAAVIAADMLTRNMLYQQQEAFKAQIQKRGDDYRAFDLIVKNEDEK